MDIYIGIDLAWGDKNLSGFCVATAQKNSKKLKILDLQLLHSLDDILLEIQKYQEYPVFIGVDAPLIIPNEEGNREIEKNFNKDFSKFKISMLPVNRKLLSKYSQKIRSEELYKKLLELGYTQDYENKKTVFEVYPHATIATLFHNNTILPYKRKKGRSSEFIKEQLCTYRNYLQKIFSKHTIFETDIKQIKGQKLKNFEDMFDAMICAYTLFYCRFFDVMFYDINGEKSFITPQSSWKVYMLRCSDGTLYTGITTDLQRRLDEHNSSTLGAKYTKTRRPLQLVYYESCDSRIDASKREYAIKQLTRKQKLELINV